MRVGKKHIYQECVELVPCSNPAPPQHTANSVSSEVAFYLGCPSTVSWPLRGRRGTVSTQCTQNPLKRIEEKK
jgi:hypothetical protein